MFRGFTTLWRRVDPSLEGLTLPQAGPVLNWLQACLDELERFVEERGFDFGGGYASTSASYERLEHDKRLREEQIEEHPELQPYRGLCASRLKISGTGTWPLARYLDSPLYLPYEEPLFLMHNEDVSHFPTPCFESEDRDEYFRLIKRWDELGLLRLHEEPLREGHYTKVFNTFKSSLHDRQIGDRRIANSRERHLAGSSSYLPNGPLLQNIFLPSGCNLRGAITDRRDFYHQCCVTSSRSCSNALPFDFSVEELAGFSALKIYREELAAVGPQGREFVGDRLGMPASERRKKVVPGRLRPGFAALYQGDHLGVEYALEAHQNLLLEEGLLRSEGRVQLNSCFPTGGVYEGLIIDDFFVISSQRRTVEKEDSAAFKRLGRARQAYEAHKLPGSVEKDVVAETTFKAAGAECDSSEETLSKGLCTLGAPAGKRLALSLLSLRAASLGAISTKLALRLAGSWTSCLLYRRCLSSIVDGFFALPHLGGEGAENLVLPLSRRHAQELVLLSVAAPLMVANLRAEVEEKIYATDASLAKGAIVSAQLPEESVKALWLGGDKKGGYSKLDNPFRATLRAVEEFSDEEAEEAGCKFSPERPPSFVFDFVEICGGVGKVSEAMVDKGYTVAPPLDLSYSKAYNMEDSQLMSWIFHMLREGRFKSAFCQPPCTTFSPAAHPACRSYQCPLGWDRKRPKVFRGNLLAFRNMAVVRCGMAYRRPVGLEQPRLSKMAWLSCWRYLLSLGCSESVVAACMFKSIHKKEFRILSYLLRADRLERRCGGGHQHVRIEGKYTKDSAIYPPALAERFAECFADALQRSEDLQRDEAPYEGGESVFVNDVLRSSAWSEERSWWWKSHSHINLLETRVVLSLLHEKLVRGEVDRRSVILLDSSVARCALSKGRSSSKALQPLLKKACAVQIGAGLFPALNHAPTKLNVSDDPTRGREIRESSRHSICEVVPLETLRELHMRRLPRFAANWVRLFLLVTILQPSEADGFAFGGVGVEAEELATPVARSLDFWISFPEIITSLLSQIFISLPCLDFSSSLFSCGLVLFVVALSAWVSRRALPAKTPEKLVHGRQPLGPPVFLVFLSCFAMAGAPMVPENRDEIARAEQRSAIHLQADRVVLAQTRDNRKKLLLAFQTWLHDEHSVVWDDLIFASPPDPEAICQWLVLYGRELHAAGKSYNKYVETINGIATARPILRRQMAQAWDLAFAWLQDEPHQHHPALPQSILLSMLSTALLWGWPVVAAVLSLAWAGVMRIGEVIYACRRDLVLPSDSAPDIDYILVRINEPKSRGRAARHQSARIDPADLVSLISKVFENYAPSDRLWPSSAGTLRRRFNSLLSAVGLPTTRGPWGRPYDLGSLRPGGASWLLMRTENTELIRRRGRWQSMRTLEIYLQDIQVATALHKLDEPVRKKIAQLAAGFPSILEKALVNLICKIPCNAWFFLYAQPS